MITENTTKDNDSSKNIFASVNTNKKQLNQESRTFKSHKQK